MANSGKKTETNVNYKARNTIYGGNRLKFKAEQQRLPCMLKAKSKSQIVSIDFSCRHQVTDLSGRKSRPVAEVVQGFL